ASTAGTALRTCGLLTEGSRNVCPSLRGRVDNRAGMVVKEWMKENRMSHRIGFRPGKSLRWLDAASGGGFITLALWFLLPLSVAIGLLTAAIGLLSAGTLSRAKGGRSAEFSVGEDLEGELRRLTELWQDGLLGDPEYERRRVEIMRPQW